MMWSRWSSSYRDARRVTGLWGGARKRRGPARLVLAVEARAHVVDLADLESWRCVSRGGRKNKNAGGRHGALVGPGHAVREAPLLALGHDLVVRLVLVVGAAEAGDDRGRVLADLFSPARQSFSRYAGESDAGRKTMGPTSFISDCSSELAK